MSIQILAGSFGPCTAQLGQHGLELPGETIPYEHITVLSPNGLDKVHSATGSANMAVSGALLFGRPAWAISSNAWGGDVLEVTFVVELADGRHFLAKADNDVFLSLKAAFLAE